MNSEAMQKPVADQGAEDANRRVADETKTTAPYNLARQPSGNDPDDKMTTVLDPTDASSCLCPSL
jgi:hypothetical protein